MRFRDGTVAITALVAFSFWLFVVLPFYYGPSNNQTADQCATEEYKNHGFWEKTRCDPVAYFTAWLVGFTGVLAFSTIGLWISTRAAARGGERAANIAESALTKLERAFVFVKEINLINDCHPLGPVYQYRVSAILENSGRTPAVRLLYNFNCGYISTENIKSFDFGDQDTPGRAVLGPQAELHTFDRRISPANMNEIIKGRDRWFIWGWVDYDDIFTDTPRHRMEFCFEIKGRPMASGNPQINFLPHDRFNATDDDCLYKPQPYSAA